MTYFYNETETGRTARDTGCNEEIFDQEAEKLLGQSFQQNSILLSAGSRPEVKMTSFSI